mgnify:CR=1 FL=1
MEAPAPDRRIRVDDETDVLVGQHRDRREILVIERIGAGDAVGDDGERRSDQEVRIVGVRGEIGEAHRIAAARLVDDGDVGFGELLRLHDALEQTKQQLQTLKASLGG